MVSAVAIVVALAFAAPGDAAPVSLQLWAVDAVKEGRPEPYFERGVDEIRSAVEGLPFDTYREVASDWQATPMNEPARMTINGKYTVIVVPRAREADGRVRLEVTVEMVKEAGKPPIKALETRVLCIPDKHITLRGLKLDNGHDLLVILSAEQ